MRIDRLIDEPARGKDETDDAIGRATPDNRFRIAAVGRRQHG
jgi:hypothetical protein